MRRKTLRRLQSLSLIRQPVILALTRSANITRFAHITCKANITCPQWQTSFKRKRQPESCLLLLFGASAGTRTRTEGVGGLNGIRSTTGAYKSLAAFFQLLYHFICFFVKFFKTRIKPFIRDCYLLNPYLCLKNLFQPFDCLFDILLQLKNE